MTSTETTDDAAEITLLTMPEVAQRLRVSLNTVRRMLDRGELPRRRIGQRRVRIAASDVRALIEKG